MAIIATNLIPMDGLTIWPFVFARPAMRSNRGLIEHELVHYREQRWWTPVWWARYLLSPAFRQAAEVRAYRRQIEVGGIGAAVAAHYLSTRYRLDLSYARALALLTEA